MSGARRGGDPRRMLNALSYRNPSLIAIAAAGTLALAAKSPALAASCAPGAVDKPDLGFVDSNCDGIDGDKGSALFVAPNGSDANDGTFGHPMATVKAAVTAATTANKDVYAAAGVYDGKPGFLGSTGHIGLYGGYDTQTWQRSAANVTTLQAPGQVVGIAGPGITLQLLNIHSLSGASALSSYGVRAWGNGAVALSRVTIQTADGANGADAADASQTPPAKTAQGPQGAGTPGCDDQSGPWAFGPAGGAESGVPSGGAGGSAHDGYPFAGHKGEDVPGQPSLFGGSGGAAYPEDGHPGMNGKTGLGGYPGLGDVSFVSLFYQALPGQTGGTGTVGAGGGGGAASYNICVPGSGGGAGGRPGAGGAGGKGGGGSIGVFAGQGAHVLVLDGTMIHTANGGHGGNGGLGQPGGAGGDGGPSGVDIYEHKFPSGAGGHGGAGGAGGRGGGAAGGASIGVLAVDARAVIAGDATITVGAGGGFGIGGYNGWQGRSEKTETATTAGGSLPAVGDFDGDGIGDDTDACPAAAGAGNGCPAPEDVPSGPVAGDPGATAPADGGSGSGSTATAAVAVSVLPAASCIDRRVFRIRINARKAHIKTARLVLDGHRLKLVKGSRRWTAKVDLRHSTRTRHTLTIRGKLRSGRRFKQTRHYRTCATS
jgi:hypothetical protein